MRTNSSIHLDGAPSLSVDSYEGTYWLRLQDASTDHVAIFSDVPREILARAAEAFNAEIARGQSETPLAAE